MTNHYELLTIFPATLSDEEAQGEKTKIADLIKNLAGSIIKEEWYGRKRLAYPIRTSRSGIFSNIQFEMDPQNTKEFCQSLKLNVKTDRVSLTHYVSTAARIPSPPLAPSKKQTEVKRAELKPEEIEQLDTKIEEILSEEIK